MTFGDTIHQPCEVIEIIVVKDDLIAGVLLAECQYVTMCCLTNHTLLTAKSCWNMARKKPLCFTSFDLGLAQPF